MTTLHDWLLVSNLYVQTILCDYFGSLEFAGPSMLASPELVRFSPLFHPHGYGSLALRY